MARPKKIAHPVRNVPLELSSGYRNYYLGVQFDPGPVLLNPALEATAVPQVVRVRDVEVVHSTGLAVFNPEYTKTMCVRKKERERERQNKQRGRQKDRKTVYL